MTRSQKRKIATIVVLALTLALLGAYYLYYRSTKKLTFDIAPVAGTQVQPPEFLYAFSGQGTDRLQRPIGIAIDGNDVFVVDSLRRKIDVFTESGRYVRSFGGTETITPLYIAKNPKDGNLYVSDRRTRSVHIFSRDGRYLREFNPKLPRKQRPAFETGGVQWAPVALAFDSDGSFYVTEILNGHRLLIFDPAGKFKRSIGNVGAVADSKTQPGLFLFPNAVTLHEGKVFVTDSNNRRVQIFDKQGKFDRLVVTEGLPRGLAFLKPFPQDEKNTPDRYVVVDTLAHDGTIWSTSDEKIVSFGQQGLLEGQFSYPNGVAVGFRNKIFLSDTANGRVQVWGWPEQAAIVSPPRLPRQWWTCLLPLLLLPLLLLRRRRRLFATPDFLDAMLAEGEADLMPGGRRMWYVTDDTYERYKDVEQGDVKFADLLNVHEHSESDTQALMDKLEIDYDTAKTLAVAQRVKVFATEGDAMRKLARVLEIDVINRVEFLDRYHKRSANQGDSA